MILSPLYKALSGSLFGLGLLSDNVRSEHKEECLRNQKVFLNNSLASLYLRENEHAFLIDKVQYQTCINLRPETIYTIKSKKKNISGLVFYCCGIVLGYHKLEYYTTYGVDA